jgi:hypothetical protein
LEDDSVALFGGRGRQVGKPVGPWRGEGVSRVYARVDVAAIIFFANGDEIVA